MNLLSSTGNTEDKKVRLEPTPRRLSFPALLSLVIAISFAGAWQLALAEKASPGAQGALTVLDLRIAQLEDAPETIQEALDKYGQMQEGYPLTLRESIERALGRNLDIAVGRLNPEIRASQVVLEESRFDSSFKFVAFSDEQKRPTSSVLDGADILENQTNSLEITFNDPLPTGGSYSFRLLGLRNETNSAFSDVNPAYVSDWQISFTQPLLKNFGLDANRTQLTVARNNQEISQNDFRQEVMNVISDVEKAYWDLSYRILDLEVNNQSLQLAEDLLRLNQVKVRVGTLAPIEITQAEAGVADREEGVILAQSEIHNAEDRLKQLMGPPSDPLWAYTLLPSDDPPFDESVPDLGESLERAMSERPDLDRARIDRRSREVEYAFARNQRRMDLTLDASYGANGLGGDEGVLVCVDTSNIPTGDAPADCLAPDRVVRNIISVTDLGDALEQARERDSDSWRVGLTLTVPVGNRNAASRY
ncbi:MAG: TolC family protein, partial [Acidobacteria bacterium]|nr:TolC family protein [Acidobacteriota bacterium]